MQAQWRRNVRYLLVTCGLLLASGRVANAQQIDPRATAITYCYNNAVASLISVAVLNTDSTDEVLAHERSHRRQMMDSIVATGACPTYATVQSNLQSEIIAYCASDSVRVQRTHDPQEASRSTMLRLVAEFVPTLPVDSVAAAWVKQCP